MKIVGEMPRSAMNRRAGDVWSMACGGPVSITSNGKPTFVIVSTMDMAPQDWMEEFPKADVGRRGADLWMMASREAVRITAHGKARFLILPREEFDAIVAGSCDPHDLDSPITEEEQTRLDALLAR